MILTFQQTMYPLLMGHKTVTRRVYKPLHNKRWMNQWDKAKFWHDAYTKSPQYGGKYFGKICLRQRPYMSRFIDMTEEDLEAEGGLWDTIWDYIGERDPYQECLVIPFLFCAPQNYELIQLLQPMYQSYIEHQKEVKSNKT